MRKLIFGINITLDGCVDHTKGIPDEEAHDYWTNQMHQAGVLMYGRKTYELMVPFWPDMARNQSGTTKSMNDFAKAFDEVEKIVVFSRTLDKVNNPKTTIISTDLKEAVLKLKQEEGGDIMLGGVDIPSQLMELDLIDEYRFVVQPLLAGEGRRLLEGIALADMLKLNLVETRHFKSGSMALHYVR